MPVTARVSHLAAVTALVMPFWAMLPAGASAQDQHPPRCSDASWLRRVRAQYNGAEEIRQNTVRIKDIAGVKETWFGDAPKSFNQYANSHDRILNVRWCQATLMLNDGQSDTIYWFLADELDSGQHSTVVDHCSGRHNLTDETCAKYREHR